MIGYISILAVLACGISATPPSPRIGGGVTAIADGLHSCLLLVERKDLEVSAQVAFGGGSIVSRNRVLTAAHVVRGATVVQAGFYNQRVAAGRMRRADSIYVQPIQSFDPESFENDLAIVVFPDNSFQLSNVIAISSAVPDGDALLSGYGYVLPTSKQPNQFPLLAEHTVGECPTEDVLKVTESHFCADTTAPAVVCLGDGGSGLYTESDPATVGGRRLVGVASLMNHGCSAAGAVAFSKLSDPSVVSFLLSQGIRTTE